MSVDAIVAVLKLLILLSDTVVPTAKKSTDSGGDIIQSMLKVIKMNQEKSHIPPNVF